MLNKTGWEGIKTGVTIKAGPCLASANSKFIIVLLNSINMDSRWTETLILNDYAVKYYS